MMPPTTDKEYIGVVVKLDNCGRDANYNVMGQTEKVRAKLLNKLVKARPYHSYGDTVIYLAYAFESRHPPFTHNLDTEYAYFKGTEIIFFD